MAKPRTGNSPPPAGGSGGGGGPPGRPPRAGGAGDADGFASAQDKVDQVARLGRAGAASRGAVASEPVRGPAAKIPLKPPNSRHHLASIRPSNPAKKDNTVVLPGTDIAADLVDISAGRGMWIAQHNVYEVNGRTYAVESTGTVFPVSGPGFVNLTRSEYKVLQHLIGSDGDVATAREALRRDPSVRDADWQSALEVFRHHKRYKGEA